MLDGFPGVFKGVDGKVYDLRPKDSCPSFENLKSKPFKYLSVLLEKALDNQIKVN